MHSLNTIFYGPPGTGKTFLTSQRAVQIIENISEPEFREKYPASQRGELRARYDEYQKQGKIALLTFHPSFAYEDFVEGIKPFKNEHNDLYYDVVDGVFKQMCFNAAYSLYLAQQQRSLDSLTKNTDKKNKSVPLRPFDALYFEFVDYLKRMMQEGSEEITFESKQGKAILLADINQNNTLSFQTDKSSKHYLVTKKKLAKLYQAFPSVESIKNLSQDIGEVVGRSNTSVMWAAFRRLKDFEATRYQTYNTLLNNYRLSGNSVSKDQYQQMKRAILSLDYSSISSEDYQQAGNFVLIIDEINRGNPASLFGELISLIEEDKRAGTSESLQTVLPYSREPFQVPPNLFIIGTMNTADRSVDRLDMAFRRRFSFEAIRPDPTLLQSTIQISLAFKNSDQAERIYNKAAEAEVEYGNIEIHLDKFLTSLNQRILWLNGEDYQLGHGYLMPVLSAKDPVSELRKSIYQRIIPLIEEYYFDDWTKRIYLLGSDFVEETSGQPPNPEILTAESGFPSLPDKLYRWKSLNDKEFIKAVQNVYRRD